MPKKSVSLPVISVSEAQNLKREIAATEAYVREVSGEAPMGEAELAVSDVADVSLESHKAKIARAKKYLELRDPENHKLTGADRLKGEKRWKELGDWLSERMLTLAEQGAFPSSKDEVKDQMYQRAVEKASSKDGENTREFVLKALEWQNLGRRLWPSDPEKSNTNLLRKEGTSSGRHF